MFEELAHMTWRLRSPRVSICKLEAQESQWYNSAKGLRTGGIPVLEKEMRWDVPVQQQGRKKGGISYSSTFYSIQALGGLGDAHPHWGESICFIEPTHSNANLARKYPHKDTQAWSLMWAPWPVYLIHRINPHTELFLIYLLDFSCAIHVTRRS